MKGQFYRIDWDTCDRLHLYGREAMVYSALIYLCKKAPYTGSATDLADFSRCGKKMTTLRMLSSLEKKGLIIRNEHTISLAQIEPSSDQNETVSAQFETISKEEKENQKKKEIYKEMNEVNVSSCAREEKKKSASPQNLIFNRLFNMDVLFDDKSKIPASTGYYRIVTTEYGYLNPKQFVKEFYNYWNGNGWPKDGNKLSLMRSWMDLHIHKYPKSKPQLNEIERAVLRTFLDHIEQRIITRLFDVMTSFEVTDTKIIFTVHKENVQDFAAWLETLPLATIFAAYKRGVTVVPDVNSKTT